MRSESVESAASPSMLRSHTTSRTLKSTSSCSTETSPESSPSNSFRSAKVHHKVIRAIRKRYKITLENKLFLKQHRYRLHCEQKTVKTIMVLLVAFTISWSPYLLVSLIGLFGDKELITYQYTILASLIAKASMVFNPVLYSISHPKVRKKILKLIRCEMKSPDSLAMNSRVRSLSRSSPFNSRA